MPPARGECAHDGRSRVQRHAWVAPSTRDEPRELAQRRSSAGSVPSDLPHRSKSALADGSGRNLAPESDHFTCGLVPSFTAPAQCRPHTAHIDASAHETAHTDNNRTKSHLRTETHPDQRCWQPM